MTDPASAETRTEQDARTPDATPITLTRIEPSSRKRPPLPASSCCDGDTCC